MGQFIFFTLFVIALLAGAFAYFAPQQKPINPVQFMMEKTGYTAEETTNHKQTEQLNLTTNQGLINVHKQMDEIAFEQNKFLDSIRDQQQILKSSGKEASDIMLMAQQNGGTQGTDILQLKALASEMQDEQRILIAHGQDLIALNDQLTRNRQWIVDQIDAADISNESSLHSFQQRYAILQDQAENFFDQVNQHNQEVHDRMTRIQDQLNDLANKAVYNSTMQQQGVNVRVQRMLMVQHENMIKLADAQDLSRNLVKDAKRHLNNSKRLFNDALQRSRDIIDDENQKAEDQKLANQQRADDQKQLIKDLQKR